MLLVAPGVGFTGEVMKITSKLSRIGAGTLFVLFVLFAFVSTGCSVTNSGMTLPNPYYLKDRPEYHPRGTEYPFPNEAAVLQGVDQEQQRGF